MQKLYVEDLIPHPKNDYFFDPMEGQKWQEFLESVKTSGVIEPPVVTADSIIVSGHQRIRACKELGITEIYCELRKYDSEDKVLKDLIETNIRQRGNINSSELKMGRIIKELERIYGIKNGNNQHQEPSNNVGSQKTQEDIAEELGLNKETYRLAKKLVSLPQEYQDLIESGALSSSTASRIISKLSEEEQMQLLRNLPATAKLTQAQVQAEVGKIKGQYEEELGDANERLREAQSLMLPQDKDYDTVVEERDKYKDESRKWYEETAQERKAKVEAERKLKAKEQEATDLARRLEKAATKQETKEVIKEVVPEKYLKMETEISRLKEQLAMANATDEDISTQIKRIELVETESDIIQGEALRLQSMVSGFANDVDSFADIHTICKQMPEQYKDIIINSAKDAMGKLNNIITYLKEDYKTWKTA